MWRRHGRHVLVLTSAGKPVFTRHGGDGDAVQLTSVITALLGRAAEGGDGLRSLALADGTTVVFAARGQVVLCCVCRTPEPEAATRATLAALHGFLALTLTGAVLDRVAERAGAGGDLRPHLAGTRGALLNVVRAGNRLPGPWLGATPLLSIGPATRAKLVATLTAGAAGCPGIVYAAVVAGYALVGWAQPRAAGAAAGGGDRDRDHGGDRGPPPPALQPSDAHLLCCLLQSAGSFRRAQASLSPVCLPGLHPGGYLQAWISMLAEVPPARPSLAATLAAGPAAGAAPDAAAPGGDGGPHAHYHIDRAPPAVYLVLVSQAADPSSAMALATSTAAIAGELRGCGALDAVARTLALAGPVGCGDYDAARYRERGCLHLLHVWRPYAQYSQSTLPAVVATHAQRKALLRAYAHAHDAVTLGGGGGGGGGGGKGAPRHFVASFPELAGGPPGRGAGAPARRAGPPEGDDEEEEEEAEEGRQRGGAAGAGAASSSSGEPPPPGVATIAAISTTHALLLAAFDASVAHADVPAAMERLAKALRADNDRLLLASPGSL